MGIRNLRIRIAVVSGICGLLTTLQPQSSFAYNQWIDCVVISSAGLSPFLMFGSPEYEIKISNGCQGDMGSVDLYFDSGSFDVLGWNNKVSIYNLSSYSTTKSFSLQNIKPGIYYPKIKITATKDYSYKTVTLPSFTIEAPQQPNLGNNGGSIQLQPDSLNTKQVCTTSTIAGTKCSSYPNWAYAICSTNPSGVLQEKVGVKWVKLWNFKGTVDSSCGNKYPYFVQINGSTSKNSGTTQMRLVFSKTLYRNSWTDYFKVTLP